MGILSGRKRFKDYLKTDDGYQLMSRWTKSDAVVMGDGNNDADTLEYRLGAIKGISDSLTSDNSNIALSANAGKNLQQQITDLTGKHIKCPISTISGHNGLNVHLRSVVGGHGFSTIMFCTEYSVGIVTIDATQYSSLQSVLNKVNWIANVQPNNITDVSVSVTDDILRYKFSFAGRTNTVSTSIIVIDSLYTYSSHDYNRI